MHSSEYRLEPEPASTAQKRDSNAAIERPREPRSHSTTRLRGSQGLDSEGRIPDSEWARALESEGASASRIRNLEGSIPVFHRPSDAV